MAILSKFLDLHLDLHLGSPLDSHLDHIHSQSRPVSTIPNSAPHMISCFKEKSSHLRNKHRRQEINLGLAMRASNVQPLVLQTSLNLELENAGSEHRSCYPALPTTTRSATCKSTTTFKPQLNMGPSTHFIGLVQRRHHATCT